MTRINYDKLLSHIPIDEVAKRLGMELVQDSGKVSKALCPFHDDKNPSLQIYSNHEQGRPHFHCFACGAHGDAIDLVKVRLNTGFREAVDWLSSGFGVTPIGKTSGVGHSRSASRVEAGSGLEMALRMYQRGSNKERLDEWIAGRNLDPAVIHRAGFSHVAGGFLSGRLAAEQDASRRRERAGLLEDAHLVKKIFPGVSQALHLRLSAGNDLTATYSDFFIGERVVFPIHDDKKQLVGLGARSVGNTVRAASPKYQFTRGFAKSKVLYRAEQAFERIRQGAKQGKKEQAIFICEGFLDALRLEAIGVEAVAVMGNALSEQQTQLLKNLCNSLPGKDSSVTVYVCFDRDEAGLRGSADACLKLLAAGIDCQFCSPTDELLAEVGVTEDRGKDPNDYLMGLSPESARDLLLRGSYSAPLAILAFAFGTTANDALTDSIWSTARRSRRVRALTQASTQLRRVVGRDAASLLLPNDLNQTAHGTLQSLQDWANHLAEASPESRGALSEEFLDDAQARLNHARLLAYMGSKRGELPCDEPRWERLDVAATAFNALLVERLESRQVEPLGAYDAVWVPRSFGGSEPRLKMMPRPEDLTIQQYLLNELLTERWDHRAYSDLTFSRSIPAVRYYREERRTVTTGFDAEGKGDLGELNSRTLSFAYQIDMDVVEGRQPASSQGMYRPFHECWLDFMKSVSRQVSEIGYVYAVRLDVKRYYDRLRRYVVRDSLQAHLTRAIESVIDNTPGFAELLGMQTDKMSAVDKATAVLERLDEQLFGVAYSHPDTGDQEFSDPARGIPQGPVLSAWIGSIALFPLDEEANRIIERLNTDKTRVGYARYVDDIVLLADSPSALSEIRDSIDRIARSLELTLLAKADEIPAMSAEEFSEYINKGRALAGSGPAWEPPLIGDGESGWDFWSVGPSTDRQSALQLLHNIELYKAAAPTILQTVKTAVQAPDLRATELPKIARLLWYTLAIERENEALSVNAATAWSRYLTLWNQCIQGAPWRLLPETYPWESPFLFGIEGLEHLLDTKNRDTRELTAEENVMRRRRITWLASLVLDEAFSAPFKDPLSGPEYQRAARFKLITWKAMRVCGRPSKPVTRSEAELPRLVQNWDPFEWMHEAVALLATVEGTDEDPLQPFWTPFFNLLGREKKNNIAACLFQHLLPNRADQPSGFIKSDEEFSPLEKAAAGIALQTLASVAPRNQVLTFLSRRRHLLNPTGASQLTERLILPPLPGIRVSRIISCLPHGPDNGDEVLAQAFESIELNGSNQDPVFIGADSHANPRSLALTWNREHVQDTGGLLVKLETQLAPDDYLRLRTSAASSGQVVPPGRLRSAASLYRAIVAAVRHYACENIDLELVPAWPYIAQSLNGQEFYVIGEGVSRAALGNRAFVRDGGRALRTIEVPIYEADLWRVGAAVSDFIGLHDDVAKFSSSDNEVDLDATALSDPARYVLRSQMRKLRGAFADSSISKGHLSDNGLPPSVERSLRLLEEFPDDSVENISQVAHVLAIESESAAMYLSFREQWSFIEGAVFLQELTERVIARLPLSIAENLASNLDGASLLRRDFWGALCFSKRLHSLSPTQAISNDPAWRALCAGTVCVGVSIAIDGVIASLRSQGDFEVHHEFDFPAEWEIAASSSDDSLYDPNHRSSESIKQPRRARLTEKLRSVVQLLGHRLRREAGYLARLSDDLYNLLEKIVRKVAQAEYSYEQTEEKLDWPLGCLSHSALELLDIELLDWLAEFVKKLDAELGFEVVLVKEASYGYNAQTQRFVDSRSGSWEVTRWMISQFPRLNTKHIEEEVVNGRLRRVWSEVYERSSGRLLSVSALGEPFASIAIEKDAPEAQTISDSAMHSVPADPYSGGSAVTEELVDEGNKEPPNEVASLIATNSAESHSTLARHSVVDGDDADEEVKQVMSAPRSAGVKLSSTGFDRRAFRNNQRQSWQGRAETGKSEAHIRVALLQMTLEVSYLHPMTEVCPSRWPLSKEARKILTEQLAPKDQYTMLSRATAKPGDEYLWTGGGAEPALMMSWAEHRRRRILERAIESCEAFKVDLLVLPEYSVRRETIDWLKEHLANKRVAVLAGTYIEFRHNPPSPAENLAAQLTLLWPVPKEIARQMDSIGNRDSLERGLVLELSRNKKYRSIALNELFRPWRQPLEPLFSPEHLASNFQDAGWELTATALNSLLSETRLPLKHFLELICSEVFLVSSPANYLHMAQDYLDLRRRFGEVSQPEEVMNDVMRLAKHLSITGDGVRARRSILAIPAATSRSADYWIAGQACQLAAGTTSVFANGVGTGLVGGSCFVGRGSWKSSPSELGYLTSITPYHGWSKGIYYNNKGDALGESDQAVVIADIDPYNMLEGKPRPQTMPVPLQLVAYLPMVECVDWSETESAILRSNDISPVAGEHGNRPKDLSRDENVFWTTVAQAFRAPCASSFEKLWQAFPDAGAVSARAESYWNNGVIQPSFGSTSRNTSAVPALYDWIDVSLTLSESDTLSRIEVPTWSGGQ